MILLQRLRRCNKMCQTYHGCYHGYWNWMPPASKYAAFIMDVTMAIGIECPAGDGQALQHQCILPLSWMLPWLLDLDVPLERDRLSGINVRMVPLPWM